MDTLVQRRSCFIKNPIYDGQLLDLKKHYSNVFQALFYFKLIKIKIICESVASLRKHTLVGTFK